MDLEEPIPDCTDCKHFIPKGEFRYTCKPMQQEKHYFCSDSTDTAEGCKYYEYKPSSKTTSSKKKTSHNKPTL